MTNTSKNRRALFAARASYCLNQPRRLLLAGAVFLLALLLAAPAAWADDEVYYTQVGMWADQGVRVMGTNYKRGTFIPVNSEVKINRVTRRAIEFTVPALSDQRIQLVNVPNHTQVNNQELQERTFGRQPVDLDRFNPEMLQFIRRGEVKPGMTRDEVIATRGYPPGHETPNLEMDQWRYWEHRFGTKLVRFEDGKVVEIIH
ncbi:hypothetical protein [Desulfurivibrio alkaliphilus]|uniref:Outer membrane protein assembly factor BamE n=1 Tax=Desulfurivibrio alkaliphilus (strain DSM 19089 / UNIQEM U267 / AHT2) TaxID=589865 RepID=D6Z0R2_DESAT|nr:hypothetical protein [Desulfurivibrio alkaliphilus]ADH85291.1 hypothetical protein DaAHT2_0585 [Desulfurivibrio alkaliphilus AHT 2]